MAKDPGNSRNKAKLLQANATFRDSVSRKDKFDFLRFDLANRSSFSATLSGLKANADLVLFSGNKKIAQSKRGGKRNEVISGTLNAGVYYLQVAVRGGSTRYQLHLATANISSPPTPTPTPSGTVQRQVFFSGEFGYERLPSNYSDLQLLQAADLLSYFGDEDVTSFYNALNTQFGIVAASMFAQFAQQSNNSRRQLEQVAGSPDRFFINSRRERRFVLGYPSFGGTQTSPETIYYPVFG